MNQLAQHRQIHTNPDGSEVEITLQRGFLDKMATLEIGKNVHIGAGLIVTGNIHLSDDVSISEDVTLTDCTLEKNVTIYPKAAVEGSTNGPIVIGEFTYIYESASLKINTGARCQIGARSRIYAGDSKGECIYTLPTRSRIGVNCDINWLYQSVSEDVALSIEDEVVLLTERYQHVEKLESLRIGKRANLCLGNLVGNIKIDADAKLGFVDDPDPTSSLNGIWYVSLSNVHVPCGFVFEQHDELDEKSYPFVVRQFLSDEGTDSVCFIKERGTGRRLPYSSEENISREMVGYLLNFHSAAENALKKSQEEVNSLKATAGRLEKTNTELKSARERIKTLESIVAGKQGPVIREAIENLKSNIRTLEQAAT